MIAIDTNVLIRHVVQDDPRQADLAAELLTRSVSATEPCLLTDVVLCELVWVLESSYKVPRARILGVLQELIVDPRFHFENRGSVRQALDAYQARKGDFSDYLLGFKALASGVTCTYTFDRALRGAEGFRVLGARH